MTTKSTMPVKLFSGLIVILGICSFYGFYIDFVPTETAFRYGWIVGAIAALCCFPVCIMNAISRFDAWVMRFISSVISTALVAGLAWFVTSYVGAAVYTQTQGVDEEIMTTLTKESSTTRRQCRYQITADILDGSFPEYLCIDEKSYRHPSTTFTLIGKKSPLGVRYNDIYLMEGEAEEVE